MAGATERELNILIKAKDMASKVLDKYGDQFDKIGKAMLGAGAAGVAGFGAAIGIAASFEKQMSKVQAVAGASKDELKLLTDQAKELGAKTSFSASQAAQGMQYLAQAGFNTKEIMAAMPGVLNAAAASGTDLGQTAEIVSSALRGFQLEAKESGHVADVLAKAANSSNADMSDLGETMKYVAPIAKAAGMSLEEITAAAGEMANVGIKGSQAGTTLRAAIMRLQAPTDAAATLMKKYGINVRDSQGNMLNMSGIIGQFEQGFKGLSKAQQDQAMKTIIGMEASAGFQALMNSGSDALAKYTTELQNSNGASQAAADIMLNNLSGSVEQLKGSLETIAITVGQRLSPYVRQFADFLTNLGNKFNALSPGMQDMIIKAALFATGFSLVAGAILVLIPMIPAIGATISALLGPVGLVIAILALLAYAFATNLEGIRDKAVAIFGELKGIFSGTTLSVQDMVNQITLIFQTFGQLILPIVDLIWTEIKQFIDQHGQEIMQALQVTWDVIKSIIKLAMDLIVATFKTAWPLIQDIIKFTMEFIVPFLLKMWNKIFSFIQEIMPPLTEIIKFAWSAINDLIISKLQAVWDFVKVAFSVISKIIEDALDIVMGVIKVFVNLLTGHWKEAWDGVLQILSGAFKLIVDVIGGAVELAVAAVGTFIRALLSPFDEMLDKMFGIGKNVIDGFISGIQSMATSAIDAAMDVVRNAVDSVKDFLGIHSPSRVFMEIGGFSAEGLANGIKKAQGLVADASRGMALTATAETDGLSLGSGIGSSGRSGSGSAGSTIILQFQPGSIVLPGVKNGQDFVDSLGGLSLRQAFKSE